LTLAFFESIRAVSGKPVVVNWSKNRHECSLWRWCPDLINAWERERAEEELVDCGAGRDTVLTDNTTEDKIHPSQIRAR
jgi:hypothetical protein